MRKRKILYAALFIATLSVMPLLKSYGATTSMPSGTVVIGSKAFSLDYANNTANASEITAAITAGGDVYVKNFENAWINNTTAAVIDASILPSVTYKASTGIESNFAAGDISSDAPVDTSDLEIISIE